MKGTDALDGIVVALEGEVVSSLRRVARQRSLTVIEVGSAEQAFQHVRPARPRVVVVQVGDDDREALAFIRRVAAEPQHTPVVAVATRHTTLLEREVLSEGATCYVPAGTISLLAPLLEGVLGARVRLKDSGHRA